MKDCSERLQYQKRKRIKEVRIQTKGLLPFESSDISDFFFFLISPPQQERLSDHLVARQN